jgi:hypothetical protein
LRQAATVVFVFAVGGVAMAGRRRAEIKAADIEGLKYFDRVLPLLRRLRDVGCERDQAGNREFFFDEYCVLILLAMFNPMAASLRALQQASELPKLQQRLGVKRVSLGSFSESVQVFDPEPLREIIDQFAANLPPLSNTPQFRDVKEIITLVDGTILTALPQIAKMFWGGERTGHRDFAWRLHTHFEILRGVPTKLTLSEPQNAGEAHERKILKRSLEPNRCYVTDRGYQAAWLFNNIVDAGSSYVCRIQENAKFEVEREYELSPEARRQGIVHDAVVKFPGDSAGKLNHSCRVVTLEITPHVKRSGHKGNAGPPSKGFLLIATNLLDVPAETIALLFRYRWQIEIFFRFFKCVLGCSHLLSHHRSGIEIQTYCALLVCLLISLWTGRKPTKRTHEMLFWYFAGLADDEDLARHVEKLNRHNS